MLNIGVICPDVETNGVHIPFAKSQLRKLVNDWHGYYLSRIIKIDGATILMELFTRDAGRVTITTELPYMESGFLDHRAVTPGEELMYWPALVEFSPRIAALSNTKGFPNAQGHKLKDGDETWTEAGCAPDDKLKSIEVPIGTMGNTLNFTRNEPTYCEPGKIYLRKLMMELFPPSVFTGKMQLFVQALYGSGRDDFRLKVTPGFAPRLELSTHTYTERVVLPTGQVVEPEEIFVELLPGYPNNGLFTTDDGRYLLVRMGFGEVTYREMRPKFAVSPKKRGTEAEAYLLAQLIPSSTVKTAVGSGMPRPTDGTPLAYGWHFNKTGSEAAVVISTTAEIHGRRQAGAASSINGLRFSQLIASFSYDREAKALTYSVTERTQGLHIPYVQSRIWFPAGDYSSMSMLAPGGNSFQWDCYANTSAPVYCYYDASDTLITVMARNSQFERTPAYDDRYRMSTSAILFGNDYVGLYSAFVKSEPEKYTSAGGAISAVGAFEFTSDTDTAFSHAPRTSNTIVLGGTEVYQFLYNRDDGFGVRIATETLLSQDGGVCYNRYKSSSSFFAQTLCLLVIPYGDASAVIAGKEREVREELVTKSNFKLEGTAGLNPEGNSVLYSTDWWTEARPFRLPNRVPWAYSGSTLPWVLDPAIRDDPLPDDSSLSTDVRLYTTAGETRLFSKYQRGQSQNSLEMMLKYYDGLFHPNVARLAIYPFPMTVRSAYFGDEVRHDWCMPQEAPYGGIQSTFVNDWPKDADTPVGWA